MEILFKNYKEKTKIAILLKMKDLQLNHKVIVCKVQDLSNSIRD